MNQEKISIRINELKDNIQQQPKVFSASASKNLTDLWKNVSAKTEHAVLEDQQKSSIKYDLTDMVIKMGKPAETFIVSDESQDKIVEELRKQYIWGILWGMLCVISIMYILFRIVIHFMY